MGGFSYGYGYSGMSIFGEKWLRFHFGLTDNFTFWLGAANLTFPLGALLGAIVC